MASNTEDIADVLSEIEEVQREHIRAATRLEAAKQQRKAIKASALETYGVNTPKELKALRDEKQVELAKSLKSFTKAVKALKAKLEANASD